MRELFKIGHFGISFLGVTIALGMLAGIFIMMREAGRKGLNKDKILDLTLYTIIVSIVGARLYYILAFNFGYYLENPVDIFLIRNGGLSIQGGLIAGILFAAWFAKRKDIPFWKAADAFAPAIVLGQAIGRIGCDVFGVPMKTIYPWGININSQILHPVQLYEVFLNLILFTFLWVRRGKTKYNGQLFINYIIGFSIVRATVEFFRTNPIVIAPFTIAHVTSFVIIVAAAIIGRYVKNNPEIQKDHTPDTTVKVKVYEYLLVALIGIIGTWVYYTVNQ